ncbi:hypothetical protein SBDP1_130043 [Syntrophobacter sp. SbD1]|nr:hypothetical protein SBDP1_130043 [Syntrophobacter sp. SbD1]
MDAESTDVRPGVANTNARQPTGTDGDLDHHRREIREVETRIIKDIKEIQKAFTPAKIATDLIFAIEEELLKRIETMNTQKISDVGDKVITNTVEAAKDHPGITALVGLGVSWITLHAALRQKTAGGIIPAQPEETEQFMESKVPIEESTEVVARKSGSLVEGVSSFVDENPLMIGFIGLSAGLILGILTSGVLEGNEIFDETRRAVKEKTRQLLYETKEKAGHVIDAARQAARQEAERQNLMSH